MPAVPAPIERARCTAVSARSRIASACFKKSSPARVSATRRVVRSNSGVPISASKSLICWLSGGCATPRLSAAAVKFRCRATAAK